MLLVYFISSTLNTVPYCLVRLLQNLGSHKLYKWTDQDFKNPDPDQRKNPDPSGSELETLLHRSGFATQTISWCIVKEFFKGN